MARGLQNRNFQPRKMQRRPLGVGIGVVKLPCGKLGGHIEIVCTQPDLTVGIRRQLPDSAHMVKVPVGQKDRFQGQSQLAELIENGVRLIAGIDYAAGSTFFVVNDVAIDLIGPKGQNIDF